MAYTQFSDYFMDIKNSPEVIGRYSEKEVYDFCASRWSEEHPGSSIPSISDLAN